MKHLVAALLVLLFPFVIFAQYVIKGKVVGEDGLPMIRADIVWVGNPESFPRKVIQKFLVEKDGSFELDTHRRGLHRIWFTGVNHKSFMIPFILDKPDTTIANVQLKRLEIPKDLKKIILFADYDNKTKRNRIRDTIEVNKKGIFSKSYTAYSDKFIYDLQDISMEYALGGTNVETYNFDCDSTFHEGYNYYYANIINTIKESTINFEFDPAKLQQTNNKQNYALINADSLTKKFLMVHEDNVARKQKYRQYINEGKANGIYNNDYANAYLHDNDMEELDEIIEGEEDTFLKSAWILSRMYFAMVDQFFKTGVLKVPKEQAEFLINNVEPNSPLWSYHANNLSIALSVAKGEVKKSVEKIKGSYQLTAEDDPYMNYHIKVLDTHPDLSLRAWFMRSVIDKYSSLGRNDSALAYMERFRQEFPKDFANKVLSDSHNPKRNIKTKNKIPAFSFTSILDSTKTISNLDLLGKKYLLHFWGTWCAPCKIQMPAIQNFNKNYRGKNFEIISIAVNCAKKQVSEFQSKIPMPWFNTIIDQRNDSNGVLRDFEISTIPKEILVDERGYIIAVNDLDKILEILSKK